MAKIRFGEINLSVEPKESESIDMPMPDALVMLEQYKKSLDSNLQNIHENMHKLEQKIMNQKPTDLSKVLSDIDELRSQIKQIDEKKQPKIIEPEVKHVTIHKNHDDEINELRKKLQSIPKKENKIIEVKYLKNNKQKNINIVLMVITALSLLLHIL